MPATDGDEALNCLRTFRFEVARGLAGRRPNNVSGRGGGQMESATGRPDAEAAAFIERCHDALRQHTGGNPRPYLELWSHAEDVSLMGGVGGHPVGIDDVTALLTAAAKKLDYEK